MVLGAPGRTGAPSGAGRRPARAHRGALSA